MDFKNVKTKNGGVISIHSGAVLTTNIFKDKWYVIDDGNLIRDLEALMSAVANGHDELGAITALRTYYEDDIDKYAHPFRRDRGSASSTTAKVSKAAVIKPKELTEAEFTQFMQIKTDAISNFQKFFNEFNFTPQSRFIDTIRRMSNFTQAKGYVVNYFKLIDKPELEDIINKVECTEFKNIVKKLQSSEVASVCYNKEPVNKRLKIYFGPAGSGKTTRALKEFPNCKTYPCTPNLLPIDLYRDFDFNDENGNPHFKKSALRLAMENGEPIIMEEFGLLATDTQRSLQNALDNKSYLDIDGYDRIEIKEGFKMIATMNLVVNGQVFALVEPLVDRAYEMVEIELTAEDLARIL